MSFRVEHHHGIHASGTKEYSVYKFYNTDTNKAILMTRWGKVGVIGQGKPIVCKSTLGIAECAKILNDKKSNGYSFTTRMSPTGELFEEYSTLARAIVGTLDARISSTFYLYQLEKVSAEFSGGATGEMFVDAKYSSEVTFYEDAVLQNENKRKEDSEREAKETAAYFENNPLYGMF